LDVGRNFHLSVESCGHESKICAQDVQDLMLGIVTFAIQGDGVVRSRSKADLRDASLAPVADLSSRRGRS